MPDAYSVTIRPRKVTFDKYATEWITSLKSYFAKKMISYVIGREKGQDNVHNHLQIAMLVTMRSDSIRRSLIRVLDYTPIDDMEAKVWLKISKHDDPNYLIGYCVKECSFTTNMTAEAISIATSHYEERSSKIKKSKQLPKWLCTGINSLMPTVYQYAIQSGLKNKYPFTIMVDFMTAKGLIPFSLSRKIKRSDNKVYDAFVQVMEGRESDHDILEQLFNAHESEILS